MEKGNIPFWARMPGKMHNKIIIAFLAFLAFWKTLWITKVRRNSDDFGENQNKALNIIDVGEYIENQNELTELKYGKTCVSDTGCEVIAIYNVLLYLGRNVSIWELLRVFEHKGIIFDGRWGTSPKALYHYLKSQDLYVTEGYGTYPDNEPVSCTGCIVLTVYNDVKDIRKQIHTISITLEKDGWVAHNVYGNGCILGPCGSISEIMEKLETWPTKTIYWVKIEK